MRQKYSDGFSTKTNVELNNYIARLDKKISDLMDEKETKKVVVSDSGVDVLIISYQRNEVNNPNGRYKWDGWEIVGKRYSIYMYLDFDHDKLRGAGLPDMYYVGEDKDEANRKYKEIVSAARSV